MDSTGDKIANPLNFYKNPKDVDKDDALSIEEKIKLLENWLDDINLQQIAESENMPETHNTDYHVDEIERLLRKYHDLAEQSNRSKLT